MTSRSVELKPINGLYSAPAPGADENLGEYPLIVVNTKALVLGLDIDDTGLVLRAFSASDGSPVFTLGPLSQRNIKQLENHTIIVGFDYNIGSDD